MQASIIIKRLPAIHDPEAQRRAMAILERAFQRELRQKMQQQSEDKEGPGSL